MVVVAAARAFRCERRLVEAEFTEPGVRLLIEGLGFSPCGSSRGGAADGDGVQVWVADPRMSVARAEALIKVFSSGQFCQSILPPLTDAARTVLVVPLSVFA